ncbi:MAG: polysaccharide deacetylase, partial [Clostridia bacterium]|nr:polysaccharide deacetylase [Clostridia bacterium]
GNKKTRSCTRCSYSETEKIQNSKIVYLTFDDGPGQYTERLLGYLRKYDVKATFFVTNQFPKYIYNLKTMAEDGHAIGVHTLTHSWNIYSGEYSYMKDFNAMHDIIKRETGIDTKIFRFPGGTNNTVSRSYCRGIMSAMSRKMINNGYYYFDWNVDCCDTLGYSASQIASTTIGQIKGKSESIVLMHDIKKATVDAIPTIIEYCLNNGYVFDVLDENSPAIRFSPVN